MISSEQMFFIFQTDQSVSDGWSGLSQRVQNNKEGENAVWEIWIRQMKSRKSDNYRGLNFTPVKPKSNLLNLNWQAGDAFAVTDEQISVHSVILLITT